MRSPLLLCDLDETLIDKRAGFDAWADAFALERRLSHDQRQWLDDADREHRQREPFFQAVVQSLSLPDDPSALWADYRRQMPLLAPAVDGVGEALAQMRDDGWLLGVVSNGTSDNQRGKLAASGLMHLFDGIVISEEVGVRKPDPAIFAAAVAACTLRRPAGDVWLIGDDPSDDIAGALGAGIKTVWISGGSTWPREGAGPTITVVSTIDGLRRLAGEPGSRQPLVAVPLVLGRPGVPDSARPGAIHQQVLRDVTDWPPTEEQRSAR